MVLFFWKNLEFQDMYFLGKEGHKHHWRYTYWCYCCTATFCRYISIHFSVTLEQTKGGLIDHFSLLDLPAVALHGVPWMLLAMFCDSSQRCPQPTVSVRFENKICLCARTFSGIANSHSTKTTFLSLSYCATNLVVCLRSVST